MQNVTGVPILVFEGVAKAAHERTARSMTMGHHQHTATILPFRARQGSSTLGATLIGPSKAETKAPNLPQVACQDSWYHQAAIEEASRTRKP